MGIMDKFTNSLGNEKIGELEGEKPKTKEEKPQKKKSAKKEKSPKVKKEKKQKEKKVKEKKKGFGFFDKKEKKEKTYDESIAEPSQLDVEQEMLSGMAEMQDESLLGEDDPSKYISTQQVGGRNRKMILRQLGIEDGVIIPSELVTPEQVENVEFTVSVPSGLDATEVEQFCDIMERSIRQYRGALKQAYEDKEKLIDEILRGEAQVLEQRNQSQLDMFLDQGENEKARLQDNLMAAQEEKQKLAIENEKLKAKLENPMPAVPLVDPDLLSENESLKQEVTNLRASLANLQSNGNKPAPEQIYEKEVADSEPQTTEEYDIPAQEQVNESTEKAGVSAESQIEEEVNIHPEEHLTNKILEKPSIETPEDYEKKVMEQFARTNKVNKHVKTKLTQADIERMKAAQADDIRIDGFEPPAPSGDSMFDSMMNDLTND